MRNPNSLHLTLFALLWVFPAGRIEASHITLGTASSFALLGLDADVDVDVTGPSSVTGNIGITTTSKFSISGSSSVVGDIIFFDSITGSNFSNSSSGAVPAPFKNTALVNQAILDALSASSAITAATATQTFANINDNTTITRTAVDNVIRLTGSISLSGGEVLTISGNPGDYFYFDLPSGNFSMSGGSQIVLTGGISQDHLFFNVTSSGGQVAFSNSSTTAYGNFLVTQRSVQVNAPTVFGRIFSGDKIAVTSGGDVFVPTSTAIPEPSTAILTLVGAMAFAARRKKIFA